MKEFAHPGLEEKAGYDINHGIQNTIAFARNEWKYVADMVTLIARLDVEQVDAWVQVTGLQHATVGEILQPRQRRLAHQVVAAVRRASARELQRGIGAQRPTGDPELSDDFRCAQVAVEALLRGAAELAIQRATHLRGNAQRAAFFAGNKNGFHRIPRAHIEQPFDGAVGGVVSR